VTSDADLSLVEETLMLSRIVALGDSESTAVVRRPGADADVPVELPAPLAESPIAVEYLGEGRALLTLHDPASDVADLWLDVAYSGDLVRLFDANTGILVGDDFNRGIPWRLRLGRFHEALRGAGVQLRVEPVSSVVDVPNEEGILLDHTERPESDARIDGLSFSQRVSVVVPVADLFRA
jgi:hypothetical protein